MKAVMLAAGKGSRLGKKTNNLPKPMIPIDGKPILQHNLEMCKKAGICDIFINLHYLPNKIRNYFGDGSNFGLNIRYNYEKTLLGTAGALLAFEKSLGEEPFFIIYGDNYTDFDLLDLRLFNQKVNADISILYHWRSNVRDSGTSLFEKNDRVKKFIEKPNEKNNTSDWVNAGIYYFSNSNVLHEIEYYDDFGKDLFPKLIRLGYNIFGLKKSVKLIAIDTPDLLNKSLANQNNN